jgi:predicted MFS family arabinose efflux permease
MAIEIASDEMFAQRPLGAALGAVIGEWFGVRSVFVVMGVVSATVLIPNRSITEQALSAAEDG